MPLADTLENSISDIDWGSNSNQGGRGLVTGQFTSWLCIHTTLEGPDDLPCKNPKYNKNTRTKIKKTKIKQNKTVNRAIQKYM